MRVGEEAGVRFIEHTVAPEHIKFYKDQIDVKFKVEGWEGRNITQKKENFLNCWITEGAFLNVLAEYKARLRYRGLYIGDAAGSVVDFEVMMNNVWASLGIRSINEKSLKQYRQVAYPDDRFRNEKDKIPDNVVVCHNSNGTVRFYGMIGKAEFLAELGKSVVRESHDNQERFRTVALEKFSYDNMVRFLEGAGKR